jgi:hypothetical protein
MLNFLKLINCQDLALILLILDFNFLRGYDFLRLFHFTGLIKLLFILLPDILDLPFMLDFKVFNFRPHVFYMILEPLNMLSQSVLILVALF